MNTFEGVSNNNIMRHSARENKAPKKNVFINPESNVGIIITAATDHLHM